MTPYDNLLLYDRHRFKKPRLTHIAGKWYCRILCDETDVATGHSPLLAYRNWEQQLPRWREFKQL